MVVQERNFSDFACKKLKKIICSWFKGRAGR